MAMVSLNLLVEVSAIAADKVLMPHREHPNGLLFTIGLLISITVELVYLVDMLLLEVVSLNFFMEYDLYFQD